MQRSKGRTAIATGLLNLDCVHECHTELHPVLALALRTKDETSAASKIDDEDPWAIFLRNSGNEGDCSADAHYLSRDSYTFFLPAPKGATRQIPQVKNPDTAFTASEADITWSISVPPDSDGQGGMVFRSASPGYRSTPDFYRFRGHDSLFLIGGGIEPGKPTRTLGLDVSIRVSADYIYLPGTGEHMVRLTIGPQFQIPRRGTE